MMREEFSGMVGITINQKDYEKIEYCYINLDHFFPTKGCVVSFFKTYGIDGFNRLYNDLIELKIAKEGR